MTRLALAVADQAVFFSEHARDDALSDELIGAERTTVVGIGPSEDTGGQQLQPGRFDGDRPFLLCLGADYAHKNRPFALELQAALRSGVDGRAGSCSPARMSGSGPRRRESASCSTATAVLA